MRTLPADVGMPWLDETVKQAEGWWLEQPEPGVLGAAIYILLQLAFTGALNPANLAHGWANPFGAGNPTFGPYYTLATSIGLGWLGTVLIIDAIVSPAGTGLVYTSSASRLSYSLATSNVIKIDLAVIFFMILYFIARRIDPNQEPLQQGVRRQDHPPPCRSGEISCSSPSSP